MYTSYPNNTPNLLLNLKLNEFSGTIAADVKGNYHGTLVNDPTWINQPIIYTENDPYVIILPNGIISDPDSAHFNGGSLNIAITANSTAEDQLSILTQGLITTTASNVRYDDTNIGTLSGIGTSNLTINFIDPLATPVVVQEVLRAIAYSNSSEYPSTAIRTVTFTIDDGKGGVSPALNQTISVIAVNDQPVLGSFGNTVTYTEGRVPVVINSAATLADIDMPASYENGSLTVEIQGGGVPNEIISVKNVGTGLGEISVSGSDISYEGVVIGTMSGGTGGTPCVISLNNQATLTAVQALIRNITYYNSASGDVLRTALFTLVDGAGTANGGLDTATATSTIDVRAKSPPVFNATNTIQHYKGEGPEQISANAILTDAYNPNYDAAVLTISMLTGGTTADLLGIRNQGTGAGQIGVSGTNVTYGGVIIGSFTGGVGSASPLVITFNQNSTPASVLAVVQNITYDSSDVVYVAETKTINMNMVDPDSASSDSIITVNLHPNTAPVLTPTPYVFPSQGYNITNDAGQYVSTILGGSLTDVDEGSDLGIAISSITIAKPGMGKWQYSINNGASWSDIGTVTNFTSLALRSIDKVRFLPDGSNTNQATFTFRGWDGTSEVCR